MTLTIGETTKQIRDNLRNYIEAAYHLSNPILITQRRNLLDKRGVIYQRPYIESTPKYKTRESFKDLKLPRSVLEVFSAVSAESEDLPKLIHDPPYQHQALAVKGCLVDNKSLVVITGTGSGKTECFLLPILGKLAIEATNKKDSFTKHAAVRAILLYPMNALVNDQLGRLRLLFGDPRIRDMFIAWSGRPARFARYTSRTLYPGVRDRKKDQQRLAPLKKYYIQNLRTAVDSDSEKSEVAKKLIDELKKRGKWPSKPDLLSWYGKEGSHWLDQQSGTFKRCVTLDGDPELLTRHEVQELPPDILITNYSMLEYMLMRPIERPIFDKTREWLQENEDENLLLVIDEAHMYRGAAGTEVALLIRRLRARLGIAPERLQIICTSASFEDKKHTNKFASQLTGKSQSDIMTIEGDLFLRDNAQSGTTRDAEELANIDLDQFYNATSENERLNLVDQFLKYRSVNDRSSLGAALFRALEDYRPMALLINSTMETAQPVDSLAYLIFKKAVDKNLAKRAITVLLSLGSIARMEPKSPGILPCRIHMFYRGLVGLWVCMDPNCSELAPDMKGGPCGKLYSQPHDVCKCGARVLELYTCRICGGTYARAYTDNISAPNYLWSEAGGAFRTSSETYDELEPIDLLLEDEVLDEEIEPADYDLITGRLNPESLGKRVRRVFINKRRNSGTGRVSNEENSQLGEFIPCGICGQRYQNRSSIQDHQTKGDQPFQALIAKQLQVQPPNHASDSDIKFAPLKGRKVLIFSDSRQTAARLAPVLQNYATQDVLRPLILYGFTKLSEFTRIAELLTLEDLYLAILIASTQLGVRLRPNLKTGESFSAEDKVEEEIQRGALKSEQDVQNLIMTFRSERLPSVLLRGVIKCISHKYFGLTPLALASIKEISNHTSKLENLPSLKGIASTSEQKIALSRIWLNHWNSPGIWLSGMPNNWYRDVVKGHKGNFRAMNRYLDNASLERIFKNEWLPYLLNLFTEQPDELFRLKGNMITLNTDNLWSYCQSCRTTQRPYPDSNKCINCGRETAKSIDPEQDEVFQARKGYYRTDTVEVLKSKPISPVALIAAEHTAQISAAQSSEVFSLAERNELLFQDVDLGLQKQGRANVAIDVLSCTTTMEVGIDIGTLSGVALRNMPPSRANYQQRSGRAGRRGNAVATVIAFGSADSHDEHYFTNPDQMIRGKIEDPRLTLNNGEIARRHITAFLLQRYHQDRLPDIKPEEQPQLFAVLGSVSNFKLKDKVLNRYDLEKWLVKNENSLKDEIDSWLPNEIEDLERKNLLENLIVDTLDPIDAAIEFTNSEEESNKRHEPSASSHDDENRSDINNFDTSIEFQAEEGIEVSNANFIKENLLDRLLYKGVLPRYAFPTDVMTFHVFNVEDSTRYRATFLYTPSQGAAIALSQYAPGKEVWIDGNLWRSGALYSVYPGERFNAWQTRLLYYECSSCGYAQTLSREKGTLRDTLDCAACGGNNTLGPAMNWIRPPGFAHPIDIEAGTALEDQPIRSYASRAKLTAPTPGDEDSWNVLNDRIKTRHMREHLLVTNRGPRNEGYTYCTKCGRIEPTSVTNGVVQRTHIKPFPDDQESQCPGNSSTTGLVLGTDFITDVLLISLRVDSPLNLSPGLLSTDVALRTLSEALTKAACLKLELETRELQAEFRPALTMAGREGKEIEVYIYDTLPGGAGFARRIGDIGLSIFEEALYILENCPEGCDRSCYRCLRSYKNKFEHELLDRHLASNLLRYFLRGEFPATDQSHYSRLIDLLYEDLSRQDISGLRIEKKYPLESLGSEKIIAPIFVSDGKGREIVVDLYSPLTPDYTANEDIRELKEFGSIPVHLVDELVVSKNLPRVTSRILSLVQSNG